VLRAQQVSEETIAVIVQAWAPSTNKDMTPFGVDGLTTPSASNKIRALEMSIRSMHG
jgi:hypothetical protein